MSTPADPAEAGPSQEASPRHGNNSNDATMGDGDGWTGAELERRAQSGIEQVSEGDMDYLEIFYEHLLEVLEDRKDRENKKQACFREDLVRFQNEIGTPPSDLPLKQIKVTDGEGNPSHRTQTPEEAEASWCRERMILFKRKALCKAAFDDYAQRYRKQKEEMRNLGQGRKLETWKKRQNGILDDPEKYTNLEGILDELENEEDTYLPEEGFDRPVTSTDEEWSRTKWEKVKEMKAEEQDGDKIRQQQLDAGAKAAAPDGDLSLLDKTITPLNEDIPEPVREIHKTMCIVMFQWWDSTQSAQDMVNFRICSERLDRLPDAAMYRVAPTEISHYMERLKKLLLDCKPGASQEDLITLAGITITLTNRLRKSGLDLNMILGRDAFRQIFRHLFREDIEALRPLCNQLQQAYLKPRKEHVNIYRNLIDTILLSLIDSEHSTIRSEGPMIGFEQMKKLNERIGEHNKAYGVQYTDHHIPTNDLEAALRLYKAGQVNEIKYQLARLAGKMVLLGVPDSNTFKNHPALQGCEVDQKEILHEILGISACGDRQYTSMVQNVPALVRSPHSSEYAGVPMETVAWGKIRSAYFYINQYGPQNATIYRRERHQSDDWAREHGNSGGPSELEVTSKQNRPGEWRATDWSPRKYGKRHVLGIYGVAYAVPRNAEDPLEPLDPDLYRPPYSRREDVYVLVGWDFQLTQKDPVLKWETRSRILDLWKEEADPSIYEAAAESQERFDIWKRSKPESRDTSLQPLAQSATDKLRYTSPDFKVAAPQSSSSELDSSDEDKKNVQALGSKYRMPSKSRIRPSIEPSNGKQPASARVRSRNRRQVDHYDDNDDSTNESSLESVPKSRWRQSSTRSPSSDDRENSQYRRSQRKNDVPGTRGKKASPEDIRREYERMVTLFGRNWQKKMAKD